ncbi:hypothetical protein GOP47_0010666 [Adiantum capillus-veneris]|uniref:Uncharacterized protein n=1 Tax=Adiantum capillus-veneris TaxID=13818 RepID=A0A9D4UVQ5_ADICA|nr:hypothetical protein GOP47_0010666 [Adiantum capillus-veneris]
MHAPAIVVAKRFPFHFLPFAPCLLGAHGRMHAGVRHLLGFKNTSMLRFEGCRMEIIMQSFDSFATFNNLNLYPFSVFNTNAFLELNPILCLHQEVQVHSHIPFHPCLLACRRVVIAQARHSKPSQCFLNKHTLACGGSDLQLNGGTFSVVL